MKPLKDHIHVGHVLWHRWTMVGRTTKQSHGEKRVRSLSSFTVLIILRKTGVYLLCRKFLDVTHSNPLFA